MRAKLTINLDAIAKNWRALDAMSDAETGAVVKANAYGLGIARVAPTLWDVGARKFFVALVEEGAELRQILGPAAQIFVFNGFSPYDAEIVKIANLIPLLNSPEQIAGFQSALPDKAYGLQLDTGMKRLGLTPYDLKHIEALRPELVISHLACADTPEHGMNRHQLDIFSQIAINQPRSLSATGGILLGEAYHFDVTRPGIGLYGGLPFEDATNVVTVSLPVIQTRKINAGESVGYGASWAAKRPSTIATVSAGYADGLLRALGNRASLFVGNTACPIVGRVSMDLITVDITHLDHQPKQMDILSAYQTIDQLAHHADTIGYEILTNLGPRYERTYIGGPDTNGTSGV